jgi:hypothetical protein
VGEDDGAAPRRPLLQGTGAAVAGIVFALAFGASILILDGRPAAETDADRLVEYYSGSGGTTLLVVGYYVIPIAMLCFVWFLAATRRRIGRLAHREDPLLSTVQLASGILFAGLALVASGLATTALATVRLTGELPEDVLAAHGLTEGTSTVLMIYALRVAAMFVLSTTARGLRVHLVPRWFAVMGYVVAAVLLLGFTSAPGLLLVFPAWVLVASLLVLFRRVVTRHAEA